MKFETAVRFLALAAATSFGAVAEKIVEDEKKNAIRRKSREHAVGFVERTLSLLEADGMKSPESDTDVKVMWDGRHLVPIVEGTTENMFEKDENTVDEEVAEFLEDSKHLLLKAEDPPLLSPEENPTASDILQQIGGLRRTRKGGRRTRRRKRTGRRANQKTTKDCKGSKLDESGLEVIRKKVKSPKGDEDQDEDEEILCFRGNPGNVTYACDYYNATCCTGPNACARWKGPVTVCEGSCNGDRPCYGLPSGTEIEQDSCYGKQACFGATYLSSECDPLRIGAGSCRGYVACSGVGRVNPNITVQIGDNACTSNGACARVAFNSSGPMSVQIKDNACGSGLLACGRLGYNSSTDILVESKGCLGFQSCNRLGQNLQGEYITIEESACTGIFACENVSRYLSYGSLLVEEYACTGTRSCVSVGKFGAGVYIEKGACTSTSSCLEVGFGSKDTIEIKEGACTAPGSCFVVAQLSSGSVYVGEGACPTELACRGVGFNLRGDVDVYIGENACMPVPSQCDGIPYTACRDTTFIPNDGYTCSGS